MNPLPISHLAAQVRDAGQGLVLLVVPLLAAVPVAAPGTLLAVGRGVAVFNLVHAEALVDLPPILKEENNHQIYLPGKFSYFCHSDQKWS